MSYEAVIGLEEVSVCGSGGPVPIPVLDLRQWLPDASPVDWHALAQDVRPTHPETADNLDRIPVVRDEPILRGDAVTLMLSDVIEQVQRGAPGSPSAYPTPCTVRTTASPSLRRSARTWESTVRSETWWGPS